MAILDALWYYVRPLVLTIAIESLAAAILRFNKKEQLALLLSNLATNPPLQLILYCAYALGAPYAPVWLLLPLECAVIAAEAFLMARFHRRMYGTGRASYLMPSLFVNAVSLLLGLCLFSRS